MVNGLHPEMVELLQTKDLLIIIDEAALMKYINRDAISEMLGTIRKNPTVKRWMAEKRPPYHYNCHAFNYYFI